MLPRLDGMHVLRRLRDEGFEMPVLILSARAGEAEKVRGFRVGADDYVTKPFGLRELLARVDALFRRRRRLTNGSTDDQEQHRPPARFGDVEIHFESRTVLKAGAPVALRPREFDLLAALAQACERRRAEAKLARGGVVIRRCGGDSDGRHPHRRAAPQDRERPYEPSPHRHGAQGGLHASLASEDVMNEHAVVVPPHIVTGTLEKGQTQNALNALNASEAFGIH